MRLTDTDGDVAIDASAQAGPSSLGGGSSNGHNGLVAVKTNGFSQPHTNGATKPAVHDGADAASPTRRRAPVARVSLPGRTLYDDSYVDREEFVRLVIQSLRDVGYTQSAETLEAESGYIMETPEVAEFRRCILGGLWAEAEEALVRLGVAEGEQLWEAKFFISQQKYLEYLEQGKTTLALHVLRHELAPMNVDPEQLHALSSLLMCSDPADLRNRAAWDGVSGSSRRRLLVNLQRYISSSVMIPQRRFATLLDQARAFQQSRCLYHNSPSHGRPHSLYVDHMCDKNAFPRITTAILQVHTDEVWNLEWSHNGRYLATASRDKAAIIWKIGSDNDPSKREYAPEHILRDHPYSVGCVAWSLDDAILLTAAEQTIRLWNTRTGKCIRVLDQQHQETVTAFAWLPDGSGFLSGGLDRKIILWDADGKVRDTWGRTPIRVTDLAVTPDFTRLVAVGMYDVPHTPPTNNPTTGEGGTAQGPGAATTATANAPRSETRIIIYDLATKEPESIIRLDGELTSVKISADSRFALINRAQEQGPSCEIHLLDLDTERIERKYSGHSQSKHVIRSCFGGVDGGFIASGSEDGNVYIWHKDTGVLLESLSGHGEGSVNSVAWNPVNERMFATCSDDKTIRIWEAPPSDALGAPASTDVREREREHEHENGKGKGKGRWDAPEGGDGAGASGSGSGSGYASSMGVGSTTALF